MVLHHLKVLIEMKHSAKYYIATWFSLNNLHLTQKIHYQVVAKVSYGNYYTKTNTVDLAAVLARPMWNPTFFSNLLILHYYDIAYHPLFHWCKNQMVLMLSTLEKCLQRALVWIWRVIESFPMLLIFLRNFIPVSFFSAYIYLAMYW